MPVKINSCPRHHFKWGLVVGLGLGIGTGIGAAYLYRRRKDRQSAVAPLGYANPSPISPELLGNPAPKAKAAFAQFKKASSTIRSYVLPAPGGDAIRLVSSADQPYTAMLRVVDPPGSFGMFSFDAATLNNTTPIPTGENIIIPVGQWQTVLMAPYTTLYGRGSVAGVTVSVTGSPVGRTVEKIEHTSETKIAA